MTNGLTKVAKARHVPAILGTPAIPSTPERIVLPPAPPGSRYVKRERWTNSQKTAKEVYFELLKVDEDTQTKSLSIDLVNQGFGLPLRVGDTYVWGFATKYNAKPTVFRTVVVEAGPNMSALPTNPPADMVLVEVLYTPYTPSEPNTYPLPAGVDAISYSGPTWPNGYPRPSGNAPTLSITGTIQVPRAGGGYDTVQVPTTLSRVSSNSKLLDKLQISAPTPGDNTRYRFSAQGVPYITILAFAGAPGVPTIPGYTVYDQVRGWDAGANSIATEDGDLHVTFNVPVSMGVKVGFFPDGGRDAADASLLEYVFYVFSAADGMRWAIIDDGRTVVPVKKNQAEETTNYEIRRVGGVVYFYVDGEHVYTSKTKSDGPLRVGSALYKTGDMVL